MKNQIKSSMHFINHFLINPLIALFLIRVILFLNLFFNCLILFPQFFLINYLIRKIFLKMLFKEHPIQSIIQQFSSNFFNFFQKNLILI